MRVPVEDRPGCLAMRRVPGEGGRWNPEAILIGCFLSGGYEEDI